MIPTETAKQTQRLSWRTLAMMARALVCCGLLWGGGVARGSEAVIKDGQKLAFMGDSITQFGWSNPGGYVQLVVSGLKANAIAVVPNPSGVSGNESDEMLSRLGRLLARKPDWMTLSCGVNDVLHGAKGVPLDQYKTNITAIVEQAQAAGVKLMVLTATPIREDVTNEANQKLAAYNDFLRALARERGCILADVNADFQAVLKASPRPGRVLTVDGVHMNPRGDELLATGVLRAFGLNDAQLEKARQAWTEIPNGWAVRFAHYGSNKQKSLYLTLPLTRRVYEQLEAVAATRPNPISVPDMLRPMFDRDVKALLKPNGPYENVDAIFAAGKEKEVLAGLQKSLGKQADELLK